MSSKDELCALARKYRTLLELRLDHARTGEVADRSVLRALAVEFPGALRELDRLPLGMIEERARAIEDVENGAPCEPWMQWLVAYHALVRAGLFIKAHHRRDQAIEDEELARMASDYARIEVSAAFVNEMRRPRGGRISLIALDEVAKRFAMPSEVIEEKLLLSRHATKNGKTNNQ